MKLKTNKLRDAIAFSLAVSAMTLMGAGAAFAQDTPAAAQQPTPAPAQPPTDTATQLDTIVVTGTRIQSQTITASSPVAEIEQEEFQYTGTTRVEDLVNQYPQLQPAFDTVTNNGSVGYPTVDLRGLGAQRTLTLVDGFRLPAGSLEFSDISIIPASLVKRVDLLTGGASAVYGSDAVAGVVNFILDTDFEGVSLSIGKSGYQHNNDNAYIQGLETARGFDFPTGGTGLDGQSTNIDLAVGSSFADGRGHAMAWFTWRQNEALFEGQRDYSSCALSADGTACGGSATNAAGNFYFYQPGVFGSQASLNPDGSFNNAYGAPFNYAPVNYYQRPDERYTFGSSLKYEVNEHFKPYLETLFINKRDAVEIAPSGAFFIPATFDCANPIIGSACGDLGIDPANGPVTVYVLKRNIEGGPRHSDTDTTAWRAVAGAEGAINENWNYNASFLYGRNSTTIIGMNDFLSDRITEGLLGCPAGSFAGCLPYNVFVPGGVTPEAAAALAGTSFTTVQTRLSSFNAYVTGDLGFGFPSAHGDNVSLVTGVEWRETRFEQNADTNSQEGNFAGAGGPVLPITGRTSVSELFLESAVPLLKDVGIFKGLNLDLGYRLSDYDRSGRTETYKIGFNSDFDVVRVRGGYNHAIRAPTVGELFQGQQIALFAGTDPCAGPTPKFTVAQCQNTGVDPSRYGLVPPNPANQYNQFIGGNTGLTPEIADTYTLGFVVTPIEDLALNADYYDIKLKNAITTIGAQTILDFCGTTGDPTLCSLVKRNPFSGDLWRGSNPATSGQVVNLTSNFGDQHFRGVDVGGNYRWDGFGGAFSASFQGNYLLEQQYVPLPGVNDDATFDCAGKVNSNCAATPKWRHIANLRYSYDWFTANLRWRYFGKADYEDDAGVPLTDDLLTCGDAAAGCLGSGKISAFNYLDLSGSALIGENTEFTIGVNNIADKEPPLVGGAVPLANGNAPLGGYDQLGRYIYANVTFNF